MSRTLGQIQQMVGEGNVKISDHGYDELAADGILAGEVVAGVISAVVVEDHPGYYKGLAHWFCNTMPRSSRSMLYGYRPGHDGAGGLITAYRPDPAHWTPDFRRRIA
jgi:hypothetical protein